jgi:hypothetical protein
MRILILTILLMFAPLSLAAQSVEDQISTQLHDQGYSEVTTSRTLLGRLRVQAVSDEFERELIINPKTGQILRDRITPLDDDGTVEVNILERSADDFSDQETSGSDAQSSSSSPPPPSAPPPGRDRNPPPRP